VSLRGFEGAKQARKHVQGHRRAGDPLRCWACEVFGEDVGLPAGIECGMRVQWHHLLAQRWLKGVHSPIPTEWLAVVLSDDRNLVPVGPRHHEAIEDGRLRISRAVLEAQTGAIDFAEDYGLEAMLDRFYPIELAPAS
jgi:hypothetical protein